MKTLRSRPARMFWLPALTLTTLFSVGACGGAASGGQKDDAGPPRSGGNLAFAVGTDAGCLDPQQVGSSDTLYALRQTVDSLTDQDPSSGRIVPWLARSWQVSDDARTFTFRLRPGATFSDGVPVDAAAVKKNFDAIPELGGLAILAQGHLAGYRRTEVVDRHTVKVTFDRPNAQFLQATSTAALGLVSPADAARTPQRRCTDGVHGSGPFTVSRYRPNQSLVLKKRATYDWGPARWTKKGAAYLDTVTFDVVAEPGVRTGSLGSGQADVIGGIRRQDEVALRRSGSAVVRRANPGVVLNLGFNNGRPLTRDVRVRQAAQVAVNRKEITAAVFPSGTRPATSVLSRTTPGHANLAADLDFDPARAKSLLQDAGWREGGDGIRRKGGHRLSLTVVSFSTAGAQRTALELVQQQLKDVGIELTVRQLQVPQFPQTIRAGKYDALWGGDLTRADPDSLRTLYSTRLVNSYRLPDGAGLDSLLDRQATTLAPEKRDGFVSQAQKLIVRQAYVVPIADQETLIGTSRQVHGLTIGASGGVQLHDTWKR
ncbi:ABC transporter substrate-binding protein [Streptomyces endophyticus]|uniref:ABC transporter substrate-binding protein n=1 Tax=Streptomyces endophyticus TaxID=714166 RepID=A0ABU6F0J9_9ACTN|nr:ABC transporter substrate-binding protein [Streptomyces endophyticus]MEB8337521.1 ABC transporter substrate-binding protein [Streptomyces endophyticus]